MNCIGTVTQALFTAAAAAVGPGGGGGSRGGNGRRRGDYSGGGDQSGSGGNPSDTTLVPYSGGNSRNLGTGGFGAKTWSISTDVDWAKSLKTDESDSPTWAKGWLAVRNYFQPVFLAVCYYLLELPTVSC